MVNGSGPRRLALAVIVALVTPAASAVADARHEARRHFREGMRLIGDGKYEEGTRELYEAYRILPHPTVLYNIGRAFYDAGRYDRAVEELERYVATDPPDRAEAERLLVAARERIREPSPAPEDRPAQEPEDQVAAGSTSPSGAGTPDQELVVLRQQLAQIVARIDTLEGTTGKTLAGPERADAAAGPAPPSAVAAGQEQPVDDADRTAAPAAVADVATDRIARGTAPVDDPYAPIVITSSRYGQSTLEAPNSVTIVTGEELRASGVTSIPDYLRRVPGVDVMANSPSDYNIGLRGFNDRLSNKVLVLVDGRSVFFDLVGATFWPLLTVTPADVERIEIVRGPGASLYGANAFSGVINIITRTPGQDNDEPTVAVWGGFPEQGGASLRLANRRGATAYRGSFSVERKRRWYGEIDPARADYMLEAPYPDQSVRVGRADVRLDHRIRRDVSASVSGGVVGGQIEFLLPSALPATRGSGVIDLFANGYQAYLRGDLALPYGLSVRSYWQHSSFEINQWARPTGARTSDSRPVSDVVDVEVQSFREIDLGIVQRLNLGVGYRFKSAEWEYLGNDPKEHHASVFFQDEAILTDGLHAVFSLRLDRHPLLVDIEDADFTDRYALSPRGALVWRVVPGHSLHATVGTAFRTPTFFESYTSIPLPTTTDAVVVRNAGNLKLLPERVFATELGWRSEPVASRYQLEAAAYYNRVSSLIRLSEFRPWPEGEPNYDPEAGFWYAGETSYINGNEEYDAYGAELGGKIFPVNGLDLYASGTYQRIEQDGTRVESSSPLKLSSGAHVRVGDFAVSGDFHFVSEQTWPLLSFDQTGQISIDEVELPPYVWAGARVSYMVPGTRLELAVAGQNLLAEFRDEIEPDPDDMSQVTTPGGTHRENPLGQSIPLSVQATLTYRLW